MAIDSTCPDPSIIDPLQLTGFSVTINAFKGLTLWVKDANIPSITGGEPRLPTPFVDVPLPGDKLEYGTLSLRVMVDNQFQNYRNLFKWLCLMHFPNNYREVNLWRAMNNNLYPNFRRGDRSFDLMSDILLDVKGANQKNAIIFQFCDAFPVSLSDISLTDESQETQYLYFNVDFRFRTFYPTGWGDYNVTGATIANGLTG